MIWPFVFVVEFLLFQKGYLLPLPGQSIAGIIGQYAYMLIGALLSAVAGYLFGRMMGRLLPKKREISWEAYLAPLSREKDVYLGKVLDDQEEPVYIFCVIDGAGRVSHENFDALIYEVHIQAIHKGKPKLMFEREVFTTPFLRWFGIESRSHKLRTFFLPDGGYKNYLQQPAGRDV